MPPRTTLAWALALCLFPVGLPAGQPSETPQWTAFQARLVEMRQPLVRSHVVTGIAVDPKTGDTYLARRTRAGVE